MMMMMMIIIIIIIIITRNTDYLLILYPWHSTLIVIRFNKAAVLILLSYFQTSLLWYISINDTGFVVCKFTEPDWRVYCLLSPCNVLWLRVPPCYPFQHPFSVILILSLLLIVFSVFDWLLGFGYIEDLEIYGRFDKHCSCLFQGAYIYRCCSGVYVSGSSIELLYTPTHVVLPDLYEATAVTQFTLKMATARFTSFLYMTKPWSWSDKWCSVMFLELPFHLLPSS
jgi:hypothetical protein